MKKYYIITFGCQANVADSERIESRLKETGYKKTSNKKEADLIVINACSVRQTAINRVYAKVNEFKNKKIILAGCLLGADRKKLKEKVNEIWHPDEYFDLKPIYNNTFSAFVPIMSGCNNFCTYCAVPYTRGREYSRPANEIVEEIKKLIKKGYKEIWLLGQNVNSYKSGNINFAKLLRMANNIPGDFWIHFTSPHPKNFSNDMIKAMAECKKFAHYLNLPIQSGDNQILKKMNRSYTVEYYKKLVKKIKKAIPDIALSTDIIVGFPSETKKQFNNSVKLFKEIGFDMAYISEYSPRPGTAASRFMKDNVPQKEKECRKKKLNDILAKTSFKKNKKLIGRTLRVLVDSKKGNRFFGRTEGNKVIEINAREVGEFVNIKITSAEPWRLKGKLSLAKEGFS